MTTITNSAIENGYTETSSSTNIQMDSLTGPMLSAALKENGLHVLWVVTRIVLAFLLVCLVTVVLQQYVQVNFYAAWSAMVAVLYLANMVDVVRLRDAVSLLVPGLFIWAALFYDATSAAIVGLTLFTHVVVAFFAGISRTSGSLRDIELWAYLLGAGVAVLGSFVTQFLI